MTPDQLIAFLNALSVGELDTLSTKLEQARGACIELGRTDLAEKLVEARGALKQGDLRLFRKRVHTVLAKLGHLR